MKYTHVVFFATVVFLCSTNASLFCFTHQSADALCQSYRGRVNTSNCVLLRCTGPKAACVSRTVASNPDLTFMDGCAQEWIMGCRINRALGATFKRCYCRTHCCNWNDDESFPRTIPAHPRRAERSNEGLVGHRKRRGNHHHHHRRRRRPSLEHESLDRGSSDSSVRLSIERFLSDMRTEFRAGLSRSLFILVGIPCLGIALYFCYSRFASSRVKEKEVTAKEMEWRKLNPDPKFRKITLECEKGKWTVGEK